MLYLVISFAKKDLFIDKKKQWKMSQNSEQLARCAGKCDFCDSDKVFTPACAALSRATGLVMRCANVALIRRLRRDQGSARVEPLPPEVLILFGPQMQKSLLVEQAFRIWSVIEDDSPLRGSPYGPLLTQRSLATLESNLCPRRFSSSSGRRCKKACSLSRLFEFGR